ncbi:MAG: NADAR family protein [Saprospiraceae bacterium]
MRYSNQWLLAQDREFIRKDFLFFWGHRPSRDGSVNKSCFSQWFAAPFQVDDIEYLTAEHWMMAGKARVFKDDEILAEILKAKHPHAAKKLGRKVRGFDPVVWEEHRMDIVVEGNVHKFSQHPKLTEFLLGTGDKILVEASPYDRIWGIGKGEKFENIENPNTWDGLNLLGYALMETRDRLLTSY